MRCGGRSSRSAPSATATSCRSRALGRLIAAATIFIGLIMIALPVGIIATAFAKEIHRRDFVVTWAWWRAMPLFAEPRRGGNRRHHAVLRAQVARARRHDRAARRVGAIRCISSPRGDSASIALPNERCGSAPANSSARSPCCAGRARSATVTAVPVQASWCSTRTTLHALMERIDAIAALSRKAVIQVA